MSGANIGPVIRRIRTSRGLTIAALAATAGVSSAYVSLIERGRRGSNVSLLNRFAAALGVPAGIIVFLATDYERLERLDKQLAERLALLAWKLIHLNQKEEDQ